jgi:thiol-disulfide isomerase/thioredoxin
MKKIHTAILLLGLSASQFAFSQKKPSIKKSEIDLTISSPQHTKEDTLLLCYSKSIKDILMDPKRLSLPRFKVAKNVMGLYEFKIPSSAKKYTYIFLSRMKRKSEREDLSKASQNNDIAEEILPYYLLRTGDKVHLDITINPDFHTRRGYRHNFKLKFSGKNGLFPRLWYGLDSIDYYTNFDKLISDSNRYVSNNLRNQIINKARIFLAPFKYQLTIEDREALLSHIIFKAKTDELRMLDGSVSVNKIIGEMTAMQRDRFRVSFDSTFNYLHNQVSEIIRQSSYEYQLALFWKLLIDSKLSQERPFTDKLFKLIADRSNGIQRDELLVSYFIKFAQKYPGVSAKIDTALSLLKDKDYKAFLNTLKFAPGSKASDFALVNENGQMVKFSDFKNKVVFVDFWYTGCGACVKFYQNKLSKIEEEYKDSDVVFVTVSIDKNKELWQKSINSGNYTSPNVTNLLTNGLGASHPILSSYGVASFPRPVLIGKDGRIVVADDSLRELESIRQAIDNAREK